MSAQDDMLERQVSAALRQDAGQASLPSGTWQAISGRMGEPDSPGILWRIRNLAPDMTFRGVSLTRYVAPVATVALIALVVAMFIFFFNTDGSGGPAPAVTPSPSDTLPTPAASPALTKEQAMVFAEDELRRDGQGATAVEDQHDMVARLMRVRDIPRHPDGELVVVSARHEDALVWLAQVEGTSQTAQSVIAQGGEEKTYRFNAVAIDAVTGETVARMQSEYEPFILPKELIPDGLVDAGIDGRDIQRDLLPVTRDDAIRAALEEYGEIRQDVDAIETTLVRYSKPSTPGDGSVGPTATPTPAGNFPTATPTTGTGPSPQVEPTQQVRATATPIVNRLSWLVIVPGHMGDASCFVSGGFGTTHRPLCWIDVYQYFVDAETGEIHDIVFDVAFGPNMTSEERNALRRFAWAEGWWALWHEVRQYNGERLPEGLAAELDRPDAPTPTPYPPTATPPANATPTATPTPVPMTTPTVTPIPMPVRVERVGSFGSPMSGTVFEDLLARMPDADGPRAFTTLRDVAGVNERYGLELPPPGTDLSNDEALGEIVSRLNELYQQGYPVSLPAWPLEMSRYQTRADWFPYLAFDLMSAEQYANTYAFQTSGSQRPEHYDIALGQFDSQATADALATCGCEQPDIVTRSGTEYYSWGEELIGEISNRFAPPMYDHVGRGPRLMVRDGEAYYTVSDSVMEDMVDVVNGDLPSLADDEDYILATRWLAALGDMAQMNFKSADFEVAADEIDPTPGLELFEMVGTGLGHDGERLFTGIVIINPDEATAERNADLLEQRLREALTSVGGASGSNLSWSDMVELAEITVEGRLIVAKLYPHRRADYIAQDALFSLTAIESAP